MAYNDGPLAAARREVAVRAAAHAARPADLLRKSGSGAPAMVGGIPIVFAILLPADHLDAESAWKQHIPFAFWLVHCFASPQRGARGADENDPRIDSRGLALRAARFGDARGFRTENRNSPLVLRCCWMRGSIRPGQMRQPPGKTRPGRTGIFFNAAFDLRKSSPKFGHPDWCFQQTCEPFDQAKAADRLRRLASTLTLVFALQRHQCKTPASRARSPWSGPRPSGRSRLLDGRYSPASLIVRRPT